MVGLVAYGVYLPRYRLKRSEIGAVLGAGGGKGTRTVAGYDEDPTSMAVEAGRRALASAGSAVAPQRLLYATTRPPYLEKTNANTVHAALRLDPAVLTVDLVGSVRAGVGAVLMAAESPVPTLVTLSDVRTGLPGGADERDSGDAAAALLFSADQPVLADLVAHATCTEEFLDRWRLEGATSTRVWEERFGEHAYLPLAETAYADALKQAGLTPSEVDVLVVAGTHARAVKAFSAGAGAQRVADNLAGTVGNSGAAQPGVLLASVLDDAQPGQTIALVVLADGATTMIFKVADAIIDYRPARTVAEQIAAGDDSLRYADFLSWRGQLTKEPPRRPDPEGPAAPPSLRSLDYKFGFVAVRCGACGFVHLPAVRVCVNCHAVDRMVEVPLASTLGTVATYSIDHLAFSPAPPVIAAVVDFDGGGRYRFELTDAKPEDISIGSRVEMTFRRLITAGGIHNYFWKARPVGKES
ncbi:hydroxymethylglutaryl-CoA synthase [Frankia sp. R43]|uniref:OB-fold domain-containing protein n=1 Tax=Frankia sp. R43 TaxID=269536 RepID=UPI0006CA3729|nr:OB-fold domain-containing protein [Frankia sp. R43]KPM51957.1 hydroxymethylglutaryl-CoA synthase [Frankia sp. R43]